MTDNGGTMDQLDKLIIKAALRFAADNHDTRYKHLVRNTRLNAFAQVAADVLDAVMTPFAFEQAIIETINEHPIHWSQTSDRRHAEAARAEWTAKVLEGVRSRLV